MKFERGRKKNQLIWSFILKDIASQSLVKSLFLIKTRKEKRFGGEYFFETEKTYSGLLRLHLTRVDGARVTHSGSRGPTSQV